MKTLVHTDKELIEATIKKCDICYVGLADTDGTPYVLPMNFGYRDGVIYLHSAQEGRAHLHFRTESTRLHYVQYGS